MIKIRIKPDVSDLKEDISKDSGSLMSINT